MKHELIVYPHETLLQKTQIIEDIAHPDIQQLLIEMEQIMKDKNGLGIAAPQVNSNQCCFLVNFEDKVSTFINPKILAYSEETDLYEEGCLSIPGVYADVERPIQIEVEAYDREGNKFQIQAEGLFGRIIQHEYDHIQGILFIDHLRQGTKKRILKLYEKLQSEKTT